MKKYTVCLSLIALLLVVVSPSSIAVDSRKVGISRLVKSEVIEADGINENSIDGTTSASKLRAIKSHSVSDQDETKLTVFLGLFAIAIIVFFINFFRDNK
ncbi:MAG: hypothetical protein GQ475_00965 [Methylococcaceae bacterium]|nr:hypothetical protein [Methylococcaceae bacterium]